MNLICETCVRQSDVSEVCPKRPPKEGESCQQYHEADWSKIKQLQAELDKATKAFKILSPYHGKTNPEGRQEAIKSCIKFIEDKYPKCDAEAVCDCIRCNVVSLARWMSAIIKPLKAR